MNVSAALKEHFGITTVIDHWKFTVIAPREETLLLLNSAVYSEQEAFQRALTAWGSILALSETIFGNLYYKGYSDGRLEQTPLASKTPLRSVVINLFEGGNMGTLRELSQMQSEHPRRSPRETLQALKKAFDLHGHCTDAPANVCRLGYDENGLFLLDRRHSWQLEREMRKSSIPNS